MSKSRKMSIRGPRIPADFPSIPLQSLVLYASGSRRFLLGSPGFSGAFQSRVCESCQVHLCSKGAKNPRSSGNYPFNHKTWDPAGYEIPHKLGPRRSSQPGPLRFWPWGTWEPSGMGSRWVEHGCYLGWDSGGVCMGAIWDGFRLGPSWVLYGMGFSGVCMGTIWERVQAGTQLGTTY